MQKTESPLRLSISETEDDEGGSISKGTLGLVTKPEYRKLVVAITGTRKGMTPAQEVQLREVLKRLNRMYRPVWLLHGDCIGVDEQAHEIARELGMLVHIHPPQNPKQRAYCTAEKIEPAQLYSVRNNNMVRECQYLIAIPGSNEEKMRGSGTWMTVRFARRQGKPHSIIYPDGNKTGYNWTSILYPS